MFLFAITVFLGAFLLFQVQPLLGRYILPWFGGGPSVWTSCMLFFQTLLLGGYAYAHGIASRLSPRWQARLHLALLAASLFALPLDPDAELWSGRVFDDPTESILLLLLVTAGLPYVMLSATSPLVQRWFDLSMPGRSAYRLYALSNAGSLLALLSYPFVVEPLLAVRTQSKVWSAAYALFVATCGLCAWRVSRTAAAAPAPVATRSAVPATASQLTLWLALSACGSTLLLATTNQMSQEIAVVPFLWILPLSLYLLSFILTFESDRWYRPKLFGYLLAVAVPGACAAMAAGGLLPLEVQIVLFSLALFAACMSCHGELARAKPPAALATVFYLTIAAGGALGGLFVALIAPRVFPGYWEYPLGLAACCVLTLIAWVRSGAWTPSLRPEALWGPPPALLLALLTVGYAFDAQVAEPSVALTRNFYGVLRVSEGADHNGAFRILTHGRTEHGTQYLDAKQRFWPTTYFGPDSGAALAIEQHPKRRRGEPLNVGVIGLGAGTLAAYGRPGDQFRFYEINPQVVSVARSQFTYLSDSPAHVDVVVGDARIRLEEELAADRRPLFDILIVDAFSSGAIPMHLLTAEAGEIYAQRMTEKGLLVFHITNRFLDLEPVLEGMAEHLGMTAIRTDASPNPSIGASASRWMILTRNESFLAEPPVQRAGHRLAGLSPLRWTDNFAGLWQALR
ncbi:MAG: hypothetical protein GC160_02185 [Acidobacteria bacterium]|nr:hypothetical protein [Acidobacteriota bacterium]